MREAASAVRGVGGSRSSRSNSWTGSSGWSVYVTAGDYLRGGADRARDVVPGRLSCSGELARHARRACRLPRSSRPWCRTSRRKSAGWRPIGWEARGGCRDSRRTHRHRARSSSGIAGMRGAPSCGASWTATKSPLSGSRPTRRMRQTSGAGPYRPKKTCRRSGCRRQDRGTTAPPQGGRAARPRYRARRCGVRHGDRGRGPCGLGRGRVRSIRGPEHDRGRAGGAWRPGRHVLSNRELPGLPVGRIGRRAGESCAATGTTARR